MLGQTCILGAFHLNKPRRGGSKLKEEAVFWVWCIRKTVGAGQTPRHFRSQLSLHLGGLGAGSSWPKDTADDVVSLSYPRQWSYFLWFYPCCFATVSYGSLTFPFPLASMVRHCWAAFHTILSAFRTLKDKFKQTGHLHAKLFLLGFAEQKTY